MRTLATVFYWIAFLVTGCVTVQPEPQACSVNIKAVNVMLEACLDALD